MSKAVKVCSINCFFSSLALKIYFSCLSWLKFSKWKLNGEHGAQYVFTIAVFTEQIDPFLQLEIRVQRDSKRQATYKVKALLKIQRFFFPLYIMILLIFLNSFLFYIFLNTPIGQLKKILRYVQVGTENNLT